MRDMKSIAKAGKLLCVDRGQYSDYGVTGFFLVLRDFDPRAELNEFLNAHPKQRENCCFEQDEFLAAILAKGLLLEVEYGTLYLGAYSDVGRFRFIPAHGG